MLGRCSNVSGFVALGGRLSETGVMPLPEFFVVRLRDGAPVVMECFLCLASAILEGDDDGVLVSGQSRDRVCTSIFKPISYFIRRGGRMASKLDTIHQYQLYVSGAHLFNIYQASCYIAGYSFDIIWLDGYILFECF